MSKVATKVATRICLVPFVVAICGCSNKLPSAAENSTRALELMLDQPPASLNPRSTLDANGQRINALLYRGLTRIDADLNAVPDLATGWKIAPDGKSITFWIEAPKSKRELISGHLSEQLKAQATPSVGSINATAMVECLESYRAGKPISPYISAFPNWKSTELDPDKKSLTLRFSKPDPYILRNLSLLRFFDVEGNSPSATQIGGQHRAYCGEPKSNDKLLSSGSYAMVPWNPSPESDLFLQPTGVVPNARPIHMTFVEDDNTRVLKLLRGEVDATLTTLSVGKTEWLKKNYSDRFKFVERDSDRVGYIAFNLRDPILKNKKVRQAIAHAIDRNLILQNKMYDTGKLAGSLLYPSLPESFDSPFAFDLELSKRLLDEAGFPLKDGKRFELVYKTTPVREGFEQALIFKDMLSKVGVDLRLEMIEPAVFLSSVRKGNFQMIASRWLGVADGSILYRTLRTGSFDNRAGYSNPHVDELLDQAVSEMNDAKRIALMQEVQRIMEDDLPYFPLWYWNNELITRKDAPFFPQIAPANISLSGALEPTLILR